MKKTKKILSIGRIVWFVFIAGILMILYTPYLHVHIDVSSSTEGTVILGNYNTDRKEEIFETYNYLGHKTWRTVSDRTKSINYLMIPLVTDSLEFKSQDVSEMTLDDIRVSFGPFQLKKYTADNLKQEAAEIRDLDISTENHKIHLKLKNSNGIIRFKNHHYLSNARILFIYGIVLVIAGLLTELVFRKFPEKIKKMPLNECLLIAGPCWMFFLCENILGNIFYINLFFRLLNVGLLMIVYKLIYLLFRRMPGSYLGVSLILVIYSIVDTFVVAFRNRPIAPWDFTAIRTAMDVAGNYDLKFTWYMILAAAVAVFLYILLKCVPKDKKKLDKWDRGYLIILIATAVYFVFAGQYYLWDIELLSRFQNDGTTLTFSGLLLQYAKEQPRKPKGYSDQKLASIEKKMRKDAEKDQGKGTVPANIIIVMNESFSDLDIGGTDIAKGITPYFDSLDNTIRGNLYVSVRGGGTCNTEYETLTGNTTAFFASGVYPFSMYMNRDVPSIVSRAKESGYETTGIHLGKGTNWNRATAWKRLQFDHRVFADDFKGMKTVHGYPTDEQDYEILEENYEKQLPSKQLIFNVTYQNHGGYDDAEDLKKTVDLSSYGNGDYDFAENYLSLLKLSDSAFRELIEYYRKSDEPTMIVMYGDHQPSLGADADNLFFPNAGSAEENMKEYVTPFVIWANYDIPDQTYDRLSANYMSSLVLHTANMKLTPYQQYLWELKDSWPVITLNGCFDAKGKFYSSVNEISDEKINEYRMLQYNQVFDSRRRNSLFTSDEG